MGKLFPALPVFPLFATAAQLWPMEEASSVILQDGFNPENSFVVVPGSQRELRVRQQSPDGSNLLAEVQFAGIVSSGLYQFNVVIPEGLEPGDHLVEIFLNGVPIQQVVYITVGG